MIFQSRCSFWSVFLPVLLTFLHFICRFFMIVTVNFNLKSTHERLCFPVIKRLYTKMKIGIKFSGIKVDGDLIIDGHHRYLASLLAEICPESTPQIKPQQLRYQSGISLSLMKMIGILRLRYCFSIRKMLFIMV